MTIGLTPEMGKMVRDRVESGWYESESAVIQDALRRMLEDDGRRLEDLRGKIQEADEALDRGEYTDYDEDSVRRLSEDVARRGRARRFRSPRGEKCGLATIFFT